MEWIIILRSLIELIAQLQFGSPIGRSGQTSVRVRDGVASVQSGSRRPICLLYSYSSARGWGVLIMVWSSRARLSGFRARFGDQNPSLPHLGFSGRSVHLLVWFRSRFEL